MMTQGKSTRIEKDRALKKMGMEMHSPEHPYKRVMWKIGILRF
jgi:hypothetical protein